MYKLIKSKLENKKSFLSQQEDIIGKLNLSSIKLNSFLPYSGSSLRYSSISYLLNDVVINNRFNIVEFGGGISTIYLAKLASLNDIKLSIVTIDHDKNWIEIIRTLLEKEGLSSFVKLIHCPMAVSKHSLKENLWYNEGLLKENIKGILFDLVIIDGPMAYTKNLELSRYPALPFIKDYLNTKNAIYLDDTDRNGEKSIIKIWEKKFDRNFIRLSSTSMISFAGEYFNIK